MTTIHWTPQSANTKTGNVPTAYIGEKEEETVASCKAVNCALLTKRHGGQDGLIKLPNGKTLKLKPCYAHRGRPQMANWNIMRAAKRAKEQVVEFLSKGKLTGVEKRKMRKAQKRYTLKEAIHQSWRGAKAVRYTAIGDGGVIPLSQAQSIRAEVMKAGLEVLGYTRGWRLPEAQNWKGHLMASCLTLEEADEAVEEGWRASVVLPEEMVMFGRKKNRFVTPGGKKGVLCPHMIEASIQCNTCLLCVAGRHGPIIGFHTHQ